MKDSNGLKAYLVGVAVVITAVLLTQTCALIWWASSITTRVDYLERGLDRVERRIYEKLKTDN